jgi:hypothetical protein
MNDWAVPGVPLLALLGIIGCRRVAPTPLQEAGPPEAPRDPRASLEAGGERSPRCANAGTSNLGDPEDGEDLDVGDGLFAVGDVFVGVSRTVHGSRLASIARVRRGEAKPRVVDLGRAPASASPSTLFARDHEVFAVGRVWPRLAGGEGNPAIHPQEQGAALFRVADGSVVSSSQIGTPELLVTLPPTGADTSAIAAVAAPVGSPLGAILAWDEDAASPAPPSGEPHSVEGTEVRGVIRVAVIGPDMRTLLRVDTPSRDTADAERPRVALRDGGFWVAWIARKTEPRKDGTPEIEGPGQERAYRWVELLALDAEGKPTGPVRRLTTTTGHASGFAMAQRWAPGDSGGSPLDLYVGLDEERSEGAGGGVAHVTVGPEGALNVSALVSEGVARGAAPWLSPVAAGAGWLFYVDAADTVDGVRTLILDGEGNAAGSPSLEPELDDARPIAAAPPTRSASGTPSVEVLALTQAGPDRLRWLSCTNR